MPQDNTLLDKVLIALKNNPWIVLLVLISLVLPALNSATDFLDKVSGYLGAIRQGSKDREEKLDSLMSGCWTNEGNIGSRGPFTVLIIKFDEGKVSKVQVSALQNIAGFPSGGRAFFEAGIGSERNGKVADFEVNLLYQDRSSGSYKYISERVASIEIELIEGNFREKIEDDTLRWKVSNFQESHQNYEALKQVLPLETELWRMSPNVCSSS